MYHIDDLLYVTCYLEVEGLWVLFHEDLVLALLEHGGQLAEVVLLARLVEPVPEDDGLEAEVDPGVVLRLEQPRRLLVEPADALRVRQDRLGDLGRHRAAGTDPLKAEKT